jgi:hypothetical protein
VHFTRLQCRPIGELVGRSPTVCKHDYGTPFGDAEPDVVPGDSLREDEVRRALEPLARGDLRILRPLRPASVQDRDTRFEIFHDVLADAILDWPMRFLRYRELRAATWRALASYVYVTVGLFLVALVLFNPFPVTRGWSGQIWVILTMCALGVWIAAARLVRRRWRHKSSQRIRRRRERHLDRHQPETLEAPRGFAMDEQEVVTAQKLPPRW